MPVYRIVIYRKTTDQHVIRIERPTKEMAYQEARGLIEEEDYLDRIPADQWDGQYVEGYSVGEITKDAAL